MPYHAVLLFKKLHALLSMQVFSLRVYACCCLDVGTKPSPIHISDSFLGSDLALGGEFGPNLAACVSNGNVTESRIAQALTRTLTAQFRLGWFDTLAAKAQVGLFLGWCLRSRFMLPIIIVRAVFFAGIR